MPINSKHQHVEEHMLFYVRMLVALLLLALPSHADEVSPAPQPRIHKSWAEFARSTNDVVRSAGKIQELSQLPGLEAVYKVLPLDALEVVEGESTLEHAIIWNDLRRLSFKPLYGRVSWFAVFSRPQIHNGARTIAYVDRLMQEKNAIAVDRSFVMRETQRIWTLLHEVGHLCCQSPMKSGQSAQSALSKNSVETRSSWSTTVFSGWIVAFAAWMNA